MAKINILEALRLSSTTTKNYIDNKQLAIEKYVQEEINKIPTAENYDDTELRNLITNKADKSELFSGNYNDLENKPCGGGEVRSVIAEYDCVEEGKEEGWFQKGPWTYEYYVKVADLTEAEYNQIISSLLESSSKLSMEYKNKETGEITVKEYEVERDYIAEVIENNDLIQLTYQNITITKKATSYSEGSYGGNWKFDSAGVFFNTNCLVYTDETESDYYYADCLKCEIVKEEGDLKQLDEKFIPDTIARASDLPCYDTRTLEPIVMEFDGVIEGKEYMAFSEPYYFVKVSDEVYKEDIDSIKQNGIINFKTPDGDIAFNLGKSTCELEQIDDYDMYIMFLSEGLPGLLVILEDINLDEGVSFEKGVWVFAFAYGEDSLSQESPMYLSSLSFDRITSGELKKIDKKFIDSIGKNMEGLECTYNYDTSAGTAIAEQNSEIFNNYLSNIAIGANSHAEGDCTQAIGSATHTEGSLTAAEGRYSHAEGFGSIAKGESSHAEGEETYAKGNYSHAEGYCSVAEGYASHSEGEETWAPGPFSHAEGQWTVAEGNGSHAEGRCTWAKGDSQHVEGRFNIKDTENKYIHIAGNGTGPYTGDVNSYKTSNAYTLDWDGNGWFAGNVSIGTDNKQLATEEFVTDKIAEAHKNDSQYVTQEQLNTVLGNITLKKITQAEYDALAIKDPNTLYIIIQ